MLSRYYDSVFTPTFDVFDAIKLFNDVEKTSSHRRVDSVDSEGVKIELPGVKSTDVSITVEGRLLKVTGKSRHGKEFTYTYSLRSDVDDGAITAEMKDGLLSVSLPKKPESLPKKIEISC
jgi:HSP20 family molecular chaperone IbpA